MPLWQKATRLCAQMSNKYGIKRTAVTYNVLLQCCANTNDFERAEEIIDTMYDEEVQRVRRRLKLSKRGGAFDRMRRRF